MLLCPTRAVSASRKCLVPNAFHSLTRFAPSLTSTARSSCASTTGGRGNWRHSTVVRSGTTKRSFRERESGSLVFPKALCLTNTFPVSSGWSCQRTTEVTLRVTTRYLAERAGPQARVRDLEMDMTPRPLPRSATHLPQPPCATATVRFPHCSTAYHRVRPFQQNGAMEGMCPSAKRSFDLIDFSRTPRQPPPPLPPPPPRRRPLPRQTLPPPL